VNYLSILFSLLRKCELESKCLPLKQFGELLSSLFFVEKNRCQLTAENS